MDGSDGSLTPLVERLASLTALNAEERNALLALPFEHISIKRDAFLIRAGANVESCCVLLSGFAYRTKLARNGLRQIVGFHLKGDFVGLGSALLDATNDNLQALCASEVALIPHGAILNLVDRYSGVGRAFWRAALVDVSQLRQWTLILGRLDARERIAHLLCELAVRQQAAGVGNEHVIVWPLTQDLIGEATGLTAVHVNRVFKRMRADGLVGTNGLSVTILDWPRLQAIGNFNRGYLHLLTPAGREEPGGNEAEGEAVNPPKLS